MSITQTVHNWVVKSKLNTLIAGALVAALTVFANAYLPAGMATALIQDASNVMTCGDLTCPTE